MNNLHPKLKSFIVDYILVHKIKNVDLSDLNLNTSLDLDLNLFDLEIDLFLTEFIQTFNIDYSSFNWKNYGYPNGSYLILIIRSFFNYKTKWVKRLAHKLYRPKIRLLTLQHAMETGILK